jgi:excisionase family DNA binding protein
VTKLLTPAEVAERLNVCRATVYAKIRTGSLPALTLAQFTERPVYRIDEAELERWLYDAHVQPKA